MIVTTVCVTGSSELLYMSSCVNIEQVHPFDLFIQLYHNNSDLFRDLIDILDGEYLIRAHSVNIDTAEVTDISTDLLVICEAFCYVFGFPAQSVDLMYVADDDQLVEFGRMHFTSNSELHVELRINNERRTVVFTKQQLWEGRGRFFFDECERQLGIADLADDDYYGDDFVNHSIEQAWNNYQEMDE